MTEQTAEPPEGGQETTQEPQEPQTQPEGQPEPPGPSQPPETPNSREARYRTERNQARAQAEQLQARIDGLLRTQISALASTGLDALSDGGDLFDVGGHQVADFLDDQGDVDLDKVAAAQRELLGRRPGLRKGGYQAGWPGQGRRPSPRSQEPTPWDVVIGKDRQR